MDQNFAKLTEIRSNFVIIIKGQILKNVQNCVKCENFFKLRKMWSNFLKIHEIGLSIEKYLKKELIFKN